MTSPQSKPHWFAIPLLLLAFVLVASSSSALPTMIRLGYNNCAACHVSPQGGGQMEAMSDSSGGAPIPAVR